MSEHSSVQVKPADDPAFKLPESMAKFQMPLVGGGLVALLVGWMVANGSGSGAGMSAYLIAFMYCLTISLGCLFFVLIQHLCRAGWSVVVRRIAELVMMMVFPLAILFLPIILTLLLGNGDTLYKWGSGEAYGVEHHLDMEIWKTKIGYLNFGWFTIRAVIYFAIWMMLAWFYFSNSKEQDETGAREITSLLQARSGPAIMLFALTMSFAAFDWVMSLAPMWFSTMFGVYMFAGGILAAHCTIAAIAYTLQMNGAMKDEMTVEHYHDFGKYIFGFIFFWTYISFSQYMLIWYGNIPEETEWIWHRQLGTWGGIGLVLIFLHWMLPFLGTMSRHVRRRPTLVFAWSIYLLAMHFFDVCWMIMPEAEGSGWMGVFGAAVCTFGMLGLLGGLTLWLAGDTKIVAVRDPRLGESIAFENI